MFVRCYGGMTSEARSGTTQIPFAERLNAIATYSYIGNLHQPPDASPER